MRSLFRRLALAAALAAAACGGGSILIVVNSGFVAGPPRCRGAGGEFDLRQTGGLQVLVVITGSTRVIVSSGVGSCTDLFAGAPVEVSGRESGDRIVADTVTLRGSE